MATANLEPLPPEAAIERFRRKLDELSFDWRDVWHEEHAKAFTVAKVMRQDILDEIRAAVDEAIAEGITWEEFKRRLRPILIEKGWWGRAPMTDPLTGVTREVQLGSPRRLRIIFDTNLRTSYAAGHWERIQAVKHTRPYLRYVAILDDRTRPQHRAWHNTILPVDHPWWETHFPPNGWNCRCTVQSLTQREAAELGGVSPDPVVTTRRWINRRTGAIEEVPVGIDPGFGYHVGRYPGQVAPGVG